MSLKGTPYWDMAIAAGATSDDEREQMAQGFQYAEWELLPLSEKMRSDIAMASVYADEVADLEARLSKTEEALEQIVEWSKAYPIDVFPEPDFEKVAKVLKDNGMTLDAVSASNRTIVTGRAILPRLTIAGHSLRHIPTGSTSRDIFLPDLASSRRSRIIRRLSAPSLNSSEGAALGIAETDSATSSNGSSCLRSSG